jgi:Recombination endonuclease VII
VTYSKEKMREYQRERLGCKPRAVCTHGKKLKRECTECKRLWDADRYQRDKTKRRAANEEWKGANLEQYKKVQLAAKQRWSGIPEPTRPMPERCECCGRPKGKKALHIDHCHLTGVFRGWLCFRCNAAIGLLGDTTDGTRRATAYLERAYS